jgi:2-polyprenyl-3-methyl-5-hydroxy-6-metoxy-1,4-benzoquinol methylase
MIDIGVVTDQPVDVITSIDWLYLVLVERWNAILEKCSRCLKLGGKVLLKEIHLSIAWKIFLVYLKETLALKVLELSLGARRDQAVRDAWQFLSALNLFWRFHQAARTLLVPFQSVVAHLPENGTLLDLGCGNGLFLSLAKKAKPGLELAGLDLSHEKITAARQAFEMSTASVPQLAVMDIADFPEQSVDVITIIDVLYLVPFQHWNTILEKCFRSLNPGGKVLLKEMDRSVAWKFLLLYVEETLAVKVLGLTLGSQLTFPEPQAIRLQLVGAGFEVEESAIHDGYFVPHHLWIGHRRRTENAQTDC